MATRFRGVRVLLGVVAVASSLLVLELVSGSFSLYRWDVRVSAAVMDAYTGAAIPDVQLFWSRSGVDAAPALVEMTVDGISITGMITVSACRAEGRFGLQGCETPTPSIHQDNFTFRSDGHEARTLAGSDGTLRRLSSREYELVLPDVRLVQDLTTGKGR